MKRLLSLLLVILVVVGAGFFAERKLRLGRELIFYSSDVAEFTLPNGKLVKTNRWYDRIDLLEEGQSLFGNGKGIGIMNPLVEGTATVKGDENTFVRMYKTVDHDPAVLPVVEASAPSGQAAMQTRQVSTFTEYWVCRDDAVISQEDLGR